MHDLLKTNTLDCTGKNVLSEVQYENIGEWIYRLSSDYIILLPLVVREQGRNRCTYPKVRCSKSVRRRGSGCGGGGGVGEVGIDISKKVAHHCWHARTHVFGRQTGEMPAEDNIIA